jgi:hypothetical protein
MKCAAWALALCSLTVPAQTLAQRDPTLPPASVAGDATGEGGVSAGAALVNGGAANVVVRDGKPFLVVGSRLVAPGQKVESYRLERITETEIWLRDASGLTKVARFAGVQRQPSVARCAAPAKKPASAKAASPQQPAKKPTPARRVGPHSPQNNAHDC